MNELMRAYEVFESITPMVDDLSPESFIPMLCLLIDYHSAKHHSDPVEVTDTMHTLVAQVNGEIGGMII